MSLVLTLAPTRLPAFPAMSSVYPRLCFQIQGYIQVSNFVFDHIGQCHPAWIFQVLLFSLIDVEFAFKVLNSNACVAKSQRLFSAGMCLKASIRFNQFGSVIVIFKHA